MSKTSETIVLFHEMKYAVVARLLRQKSKKQAHGAKLIGDFCLHAVRRRTQAVGVARCVAHEPSRGAALSFEATGV